MNAKVRDIMSKRVLSVTPHQSVGHVRELMTKHKVKALPVAGPDGELLGIVTSTDVLSSKKDSSPIKTIMTEDVTTIPEYADVSKAARTKRNKQVHHLVVTHEGKIHGILSTYDLLKLVEEHRFVPKNAPKPPGRPKGRDGHHKHSA